MPSVKVDVLIVQPPMPIYYTRCPVPTASGIAFQRGMFVDSFRDSGYEVRDLGELGPHYKDVHYTHAIEAFFREGGGAPPVWARANGVDSVVLGMTFMEELLGVFVRAEDPARSVADLAGRRLGLPVWPRLVFNFWRFAALKGLHSALAVHGLRDEDVEFVDIVEGWDPHERRNVGRSDLAQPARCEYRNQLEALLAGEVDAISARDRKPPFSNAMRAGGFACCTTFAMRVPSRTVSTTRRLVCSPPVVTSSTATSLRWCATCEP